MGKPADKATALWVIRQLTEAGHQALLAGGCVRDMLLKRRTHDYDVATDATPQQVCKLFRRVLLIGAKFGVAVVLHKGRTVEVTTFRSDASYSDGRRPDAVRFSTPQEDAQRRDFTINGMFYDPLTEKVIDYVDGQRDLKRRVVRTIGDPDQRFGEDYLRMLRAARFSVRMGFAIDPATADAVRRHAAKIASISGERVFDELTRMLGDESAPQAMDALAALTLAEHILTPVAVDPNRWQRARARVASVANRRDMPLTAAALLAEIPRGDIRTLTRSWGAANQLRDDWCFISENLHAWSKAADWTLADFKQMLARRTWPHIKAVWTAQEKIETSRTTQARRIARRAGKIDAGSAAPRPLVDGADLKKLGLADGPRMGQILRELYTRQLNEEITTRKQALAAAEELVGGK